ncbi:MAG TPA: HAMP domain-containing sensor histidine kinase [Burkholderiaceae bacterium]
MKSLYLRIYITVVVTLALFAAASAWVFQRHIEQERVRAEAVITERMGAWALLIQRSLPRADAPLADQAAGVREWAQRLRLPLALDGANGVRIEQSESFARRMADGFGSSALAVKLEDGRTLWIMRPGRLRVTGEVVRRGLGEARVVEGPQVGFRNERDDRSPQPPPQPPAHAASDLLPAGPPPLRPQFSAHALGEGGHMQIGIGGPDYGPPPGVRLGFGGSPDEFRFSAGGPEGGAPNFVRFDPFLPFLPLPWQGGVGLAIVLVLLFFAVAVGAYPVVRRLTRRLESLKQGVERFGAGQLNYRVAVTGRDEVAAVANSFNIAAARVEALVHSHRSLLANASHELRSPLARMKMAVSMLQDAAPARREQLKHEIDTNVAELDALVEEVLLASRLDATKTLERHEPVDLIALAAEEAARVDAGVEGSDSGTALAVNGDERLLRRALRNLLENARRYGGDQVSVLLERHADRALVRVCDRGPGVPEAMRERIFEPFFRLPGHAEQAGGVGLGLSLVKQIAERHGGQARCEAREGGGSCFVLALPALA